MSKLFSVIWFLVVAISIAQAQTVKVLYERKLNLGLDDKILVEHHLSYHPAKPNHLLLSGMYLHPTDSSDYGVFSVVSEDNGKTWKYIKVFSEPEAADPWAEVLINSKAVLTILGLKNMYVFYSKDAGITWEKDSINLGTAFDHQTLITDEQRSIIYVVGIKGKNIYINQSANNSITFSKPSTFRFSNLSSNTLTPIVLSDGTVLIPFNTYQRLSLSANGTEKREFLEKSLQWLIPFDGATGTFGTPMYISQSCERGFPVLAVDKSSTLFKDRLYYVCSNQTNNQILFHWSSTKGKSWSAPIEIKQYNHALHPLRNKFTGIPQVVVNKDGVVGLVWQDRMDDPNGKCQSLYFTASFNGGVDFIKPIKVSTNLSCMETPANIWGGERYKSGGDYLGFVAKPNGNFQVTWADARVGRSQIYMSEIEVKKQ
jgi:hypothetical protein